MNIKVKFNETSKNFKANLETGKNFKTDFGYYVPLKGEDGITPHIGENGNWWRGNEDTGVKASYITEKDKAELVERILEKVTDEVLLESELADAISDALAQAKESGEFDGKDGKDGKDGENGKDGQDGKDGSTPYIQDGYWYIGDENTGIKAEGLDGVLTDEQIGLLNKFSAWYDENHYVKMTGTFTATVDSTTVEIGSTITSTFTWAFSKLPTTLYIGGTKQEPPEQSGQVEKKFTASEEALETFTISGDYDGTYGNENAKKTWTYSFQNKVHFGCAEMPTPLDGDFIKSLSKWSFDTSRARTINLQDSTADKYIWYAYPKRFGLASFTIGGFAGGFEEPTIISVTNGADFTEEYYLYRSTNAGVGDLEVIVK